MTKNHSAADRPLRAAVYVRVSTEAQDDGTSPEKQSRACREEAERRGWDVVEEYRDAVSGTLATRPGLDAMISAARRGEFEKVVVFDLDRLARDQLVQLLIRKDLTDAGVGMVALNVPGGDLSGDETRMTAGVLSAVAEYERGKILKRMAAGQRGRYADGKWGAGLPPFGYVTTPAPDGRGRIIVPDRREDGTGAADVLRLAYRLLVEEGLGIGEVAARLNRLDLRPPRAEAWRGTLIRRYLTNREAMLGVARWGSGNSKYGPELTARFEPLFTEEELDRVLAALRPGFTLDGKRKFYPLSRGVLVSPCGSDYTGVYRNDRDVRDYVCQGAKKRSVARGRCGCPRLRADDVEWVVWTAVLDLLGEPERLERLAAEFLGARDGAGSTGESLASLDDQVTAAEARLAEGIANAITAGVDASTMRTVKERLEGDLTNLRRRRDSARAARGLAGRRGAAVERLAELARDGRRRLEDASLDEMRHVYGLMELEVQVLAPAGPGGVPRLAISGLVPHADLIGPLSSPGDLCAAPS